MSFLADEGVGAGEREGINTFSVKLGDDLQSLSSMFLSSSPLLQRRPGCGSSGGEGINWEC